MRIFSPSVKQTSEKNNWMNNIGSTKNVWYTKQLSINSPQPQKKSKHPLIVLKDNKKTQKKPDDSLNQENDSDFFVERAKSMHVRKPKTRNLSKFTIYASFYLIINYHITLS